MLRRGKPVQSSRRSAPRALLAAAALFAATVAIAGCHQNVAGVSESCSNPSSMNDGFFANRSVFFRVSTQPDPNDPSTTWVCYRVKAVDAATERAGRIDVRSTTAVTPTQVTTDLNSRACEAAPGNLVPPPHPLEAGEILGTPVYLDAFATLGSGPALVDPAAWLCVEAGGIKERVVVDSPGAQAANVDTNTDTAPPPMTDTTPPPAGKASTGCSAGTYGTPSELINAHLTNRDVFLYTAQPNQTELHVCARVNGPQSGGVHLSVNANPGQIVRVETSPDTTPCTNTVVSLTTPPLSLKTTPPGQVPPSICLNGTRYTVVTGPVPPVVGLQFDS
jgi:hypothetical protein